MSNAYPWFSRGIESNGAWPRPDTFDFVLPHLLGAATIQPGDILVDDFGTGRLQVYSPSGSGMNT